jgi:hypothetical protein
MQKLIEVQLKQIYKLSQAILFLNFVKQPTFLSYQTIIPCVLKKCTPTITLLF